MEFIKKYFQLITIGLLGLNFITITNSNLLYDDVYKPFFCNHGDYLVMYGEERYEVDNYTVDRLGNAHVLITNGEIVFPPPYIIQSITKK
jgi:hypothetical protein